MSFTILYVDDEPDVEALVAQKFRAKIRDNEYNFIFSRDGVHALETLEQHPEIQIVLTDINMPKMDGLTLLSKLGDLSKDIQTVIISAYGDMKNIRTAMNRGAFDFLIKPLDLADFEITLARTISHVEKINKEKFETEKLRQELEITQKEIIYKLGEIVEARSQETGNHVRRVAEYTRLFGDSIGLDSKDLENLEIAATMHDIGKVGISDSILNKPAKLTPEEFEVMKKHTVIGYNLLKNSQREIMRFAAIIAYQHHERFDGSGYPEGLKKDKIHIYGRIAAIADVFDALGSKRVYKEAWKMDRIFSYLKESKETLFDPELIDIFFAKTDLFLEIKDKYKD